MAEKLKIHSIYRHYKGNFYIVEDVGYHSETLEKLVIYRALYGDNKLWCRPYEMFLEELPLDKQKSSGQVHRFELQKFEGDIILTNNNVA